MNQRIDWKHYAQLTVVVLSALGLKLYYSTASVNQLRWVLAPTTFIVELVTRSRFEFESHAGYLSSDRSFLIAGSCAGVNFLITAFLMLSLRELWRERNLAWKFIPAAALFAYLATLVANTVRISTALLLQRNPPEISWLSGNQLHRLEGIFIYFGFLLLLFVVSERMGWKTGSRAAAREPGRLRSGISEYATGATNGYGLLRQSLFPLLIYYATTLGIPLVTVAYRGRTAADLWEHSAFVLLTPLLLILPLASLRMLRSRRVGTDGSGAV